MKQSEKISFRELAVPLIKSIDSFNYLLRSHHRRVAVISYHIGRKMNLEDQQMVDLIVAASLHDIGALSVQERDMLVREDVENPEPHCLMGYRMLSACDIFDSVAQIIRHHHVRYDRNRKEDVKIQSYIVHLADRVDICTSPDKFILNQKRDVVERIEKKVGTVFSPVVFDAFLEAAKADLFWIEIDNLSMEKLFDRINFIYTRMLDSEEMIHFALMISRIIDFRSRFTASHSYTVGKLGYHIGKILNFDENFCTKILVAGLLHDIGKIGIDTAFIEKNGPLTEGEFNQMKLHCYYSGQILGELSASDWFRDVVYWAEHHHERIDGSGYPYACSGDAVDSGTKIVAFSDIISALMENRPYRKKFGTEKSFEIIENEIAPSLGPEMFRELKNHKNKIAEIVFSCQRESQEVYAAKLEDS